MSGKPGLPPPASPGSGVRCCSGAEVEEGWEVAADNDADGAAEDGVEAGRAVAVGSSGRVGRAAGLGAGSRRSETASGGLPTRSVRILVFPAPALPVGLGDAVAGHIGVGVTGRSARRSGGFVRNIP